MNKLLAFSLIGLLATSVVALAPTASAGCSGNEATVKVCVNDYSTGAWCPLDAWVAGQNQASNLPCVAP